MPAHLAKEGAREVEDAIRNEMGSKRIRVAQTGLAGMNLVRFANITNNLGHFNGRNGFGAVMGSKNLRAVAALGTEKIPFQNPEFLKETAQEYAKTFKDIELGKTLFVYGTTAFCGILSEIGALPVNNFRQTSPRGSTPVTGDTYNEVLLKERKGCYVCPSAASGASPLTIPNTASIPVTADRSTRPWLPWEPISISTT